MSEASSKGATIGPRPRLELRDPRVELFVISALALFLELACIRWFGSTVVFLTFFTNLTLMACFLGLSVGCLAARRPRDLIAWTIPTAMLTMALAFGVLWGYSRYSGLMIDVGGQGAPDQIYFGTEFRRRDLAAFVIPLEVIAAVFFVLIAAMFLGIGQAIGRRFNAIPNRVEAYTWDLLGSLTGIAGFGLLSLLRTPPAAWFAIDFALLLWLFVRRPVPRIVSGLAAAAVVAGLVATRDMPDLEAVTPAETTWSPYYKIRFEDATGKVYVNNILHQKMADLREDGAFYRVPYLMNRDAGGPPPKDVLIIGGGSGNDVATALANGAETVDAVEIDPVLREIGQKAHPNGHGRDPRVTWHIDDGRSFVRKTDKKYDLIVYALVDSLVLHSGYSSIRLESFLFTEEAFRDLKARLKPGGTFVMYNLYRQGWVVGRLAKLAREVFGAEPIVISFPHLEAIAPGDNQENRLTFLLAGGGDSTLLGGVRSRFDRDRYFWMHPKPVFNGVIDDFGPLPPVTPGTRAEDWFKLGPARVQTEGVGATPSDDFPFLYLREAMIPALNLRGMAIVAICSLAILLAFAPVRSSRPDGRMFFLGAGFMLLETKGIVQMALLFGSTWMVNSLVIASILVMALLSNLYVVRFRPKRLWPYYALLIGALVLNLCVPVSGFLGATGPLKAAGSCLLLFVPVFFAGVVFSASFAASRRPDVAFGSNIGGAILGGLSENLSLVAGFRGLLVLAIVYYLLSAALGKREEG